MRKLQKTAAIRVLIDLRWVRIEETLLEASHSVLLDFLHFKIEETRYKSHGNPDRVWYKTHRSNNPSSLGPNRSRLERHQSET